MQQALQRLLNGVSDGTNDKSGQRPIKRIGENVSCKSDASKAGGLVPNSWYVKCSQRRFLVVGMH